MRRCTPFWVEQIKLFEGFRSHAYQDIGGVWTIGYGFTKGVRPGDTIERDMADQRLVFELARYERAVLGLITARLSDGEFDALVDFAYNLGAGNLQSSTLRARVNRGEPDGEIVPEFGKWVRAGGRVVSGLVRRRHAEALRWMSGAQELRAAA